VFVQAAKIALHRGVCIRWSELASCWLLGSAAIRLPHRKRLSCQCERMPKATYGSAAANAIVDKPYFMQLNLRVCSLSIRFQPWPQWPPSSAYMWGLSHTASGSLKGPSTGDSQYRGRSCSEAPVAIASYILTCRPVRKRRDIRRWTTQSNVGRSSAGHFHLNTTVQSRTILPVNLRAAQPVLAVALARGRRSAHRGDAYLHRLVLGHSTC